jgi:hypothetical protein
MQAHSASDKSVWYALLMLGTLPSQCLRIPFRTVSLGTSANRVKRRVGAQDLRPSLLGLYKISLGRYTLPLTFSEEELFFSVPLSPDSPFLVVVSASVPPL